MTWFKWTMAIAVGMFVATVMWQLVIYLIAFLFSILAPSCPPMTI